MEAHIHSHSHTFHSHLELSISNQLVWYLVFAPEPSLTVQTVHHHASFSFIFILIPLNKIPIKSYKQACFQSGSPSSALMMKLFSTIDSTLPAHRRISGLNHVMTILTLDHSRFHVVQCERKFKERQQTVGGSLDVQHECHHAEDWAFTSVITDLWCITITQTACCYLCL